jgi:metal-responsive CopG/Arc/MetJ family transcriptional regulator
MAAPLYARMEGYLTEKGRRNRSDYITEAVKLKLDTDGVAA